MTTLDELKAKELWQFSMHADGSDKIGRFWMNVYTAELHGVKLKGWRKQWRTGAVEVGYQIEDEPPVQSLAALALMLDGRRYTVGDDARGPVGNDD